MSRSRILLTGAAGFVGSHLTRRLLADGNAVGVILRPGSDLWRISELTSKLRVFWADLDDLSSVRRDLADFAPEHAVDLAWCGVQNPHRNDVEQTQNLRTGVELLQSLKAAGCRNFVGFGSHAEYGPCLYPISEDTPTAPTTIYGLAKLCSYFRAREFCASNDLRFVWLRLFSSYGPYEDPSWLIPSVTLALLKGDRPALTFGEQKWDFIHVRDVVDAVACVLRNTEARGSFNLGSGDAPPLRSTIEYLRDLIDPSLSLGFGEVTYRSDQVMLLQANVSRLCRETDWRPRVSLFEGLRETVAWYRDGHDRRLADA